MIKEHDRIVLNTPLPSDTPFPTADNEGLLALVQMAAHATILPSNLIPVAAPTVPGAVVGGATVPPVMPTCSTPPSGGFAAVYNSDPSLAAQMGCATGYYYAFFSCFFLLIAGLTAALQARSARALVLPLILVAVTG